MATVGHRVPVLVLSGEGSQTETIRALRLGAKDYVKKDHVLEELLPRVNSMLESAEIDRRGHLQETLPILLALPLKRFFATLVPVPRLRRMIEFYEWALRYCVIVSLSEAATLRSAFQPNIQDRATLLRGPTIGTWASLREALWPSLPANSFFRQIAAAFDGRAAKEIADLRNDIAHGSDPSERTAEAKLEEWAGRLSDLLARLDRPQPLLVLPTSLQFDGSAFQVSGVRLVGDDLTLPIYRDMTISPVATNQVLLVSVGGDSSAVSLHPFIVAEPGEEPNAWRVFAYDGVAKVPNPPIIGGSEALKYLNLGAGTRKESPRRTVVASALPRFLTEFA